MSETDVEIPLKVWKDLAISKQVLMGAATEALGLNAECSTEELSTALAEAIKRAKEADANIASMREQTDTELTEMKALVETSEKARIEAEEQVAEANKARETAERQLTVGRSENAEAIKKARADVADKQSKITAISTALADTPENVIKKLKTLKKQKLDEAKMRAQVETKLQTTRKEKGKLEQEIETQKAQLEQATTLVDQVRAMHELCKQANEKISALSDGDAEFIELPELDEELMESLGKATPEETEEATPET